MIFFGALVNPHKELPKDGSVNASDWLQGPFILPNPQLHVD